MRFLAKALVVLACLSCAPAIAQEAPPARVGRVSFISGTLAFYQSADTDWSAAQVGFPAATGVWFATDPQSRAELRVGPDTIDIAEDSQLDIADLVDTLALVGERDRRLFVIGADLEAVVHVVAKAGAAAERQEEGASQERQDVPALDPCQWKSWAA